MGMGQHGPKIPPIAPYQDKTACESEDMVYARDRLHLWNKST
jgi:hypothetical protein